MPTRSRDIFTPDLPGHFCDATTSVRRLELASSELQTPDRSVRWLHNSFGMGGSISSKILSHTVHGYLHIIYIQLERTRALLDFSTYPGLAMSHCFPSFFSLEHWTSVVFPLFKVSGSWCHPIHRQLSHPSGWSDESFSPLALCESVVPELAILASDFFYRKYGIGPMNSIGDLMNTG